jgi:hypothetical protein
MRMIIIIIIDLINDETPISSDPSTPTIIVGVVVGCWCVDISHSSYFLRMRGDQYSLRSNEDLIDIRVFIEKIDRETNLYVHG